MELPRTMYMYYESRGRCQHMTLFAQRRLRMEDGLCSNESDVQRRAGSEESQLSLEERVFAHVFEDIAVHT